MDYKKTFDIYTFEFWSGAKDTIEQVKKLGLMRDLESMIEEVMMVGGEIPTDTEINDFVWFEDDMIGEFLGVDLYED